MLLILERNNVQGGKIVLYMYLHKTLWNYLARFLKGTMYRAEAP